MQKFSVKFNFDNGVTKEIIVEEENYGVVAAKVMGNDRWFGIKGQVVNLDNVNYVEINQYQHRENPGVVQVNL